MLAFSPNVICWELTPSLKTSCNIIPISIFWIYDYVCACLLSHFSYVQLFCDSMDRKPPGSSVHVIFQARILEWVAISPSRGSPDPGIEPTSPALAGRFFIMAPPGKPSTQWSKLYLRDYLSGPDPICIGNIFAVLWRHKQAEGQNMATKLFCDKGWAIWAMRKLRCEKSWEK